MTMFKGAALAIAGLLMATAAHASPEIGKPAPEFAATDFKR